jgi:(p)ppGpp synthase/HD superfamily hydrolase
MGDQNENPEVAAARAIATIAHRYQTDKIGVAYIEHPRRVAAKLTELNASHAHIAAAWLHDVGEDCGITPSDLVDAGISQDVVDAVVLLTRTRGEGDVYYERIRQNPIALAVKLADIADNTDAERTSRLDPEKRARLATKYARAEELLET